MAKIAEPTTFEHTPPNILFPEDVNHMTWSMDSLLAEEALNELLKDGWTLSNFMDLGNGRHGVSGSRPVKLVPEERERLGRRTVRTTFDWERMKPTR